jgi:NADPH2:quinone reductase
LGAGSAIPVGALTAKLLVDAAVRSDDDLLLVTGAAGTVGGFALQLARGRGARVVAAVRDSDAGEARSLGAQATFDTGYQLEAEVRGQWEDGG